MRMGVSAQGAVKAVAILAPGARGMAQRKGLPPKSMEAKEPRGRQKEEGGPNNMVREEGWLGRDRARTASGHSGHLTQGG